MRARATAPDWASIRRDRLEGAYPLTQRALDLLEGARPRSGHVPAGEVRRWARDLARAQPTMGPLLRLSGEIRGLARGRSRVPWPRIRLWVQGWRRRLVIEQGRVIRIASRALADHREVLTLSDSSAVRETLRSVYSRRGNLRVRVLRSRPGNEALRFARVLRRAGVPVRVVPDDRFDRAVERSQIVLVGADAIYSDGSLLHKRGTRRLARSARRHGVEFCVLAGSSKMIPRRPERRPPRPLWYDVTPARWVTSYWTDEGVRRPGELSRLSPKGRPGTR